MRVAIYARYSSERQNARSIPDQIDVCSRHAGERGWTVVGVFSDAAISGAAMANRPGLLSAIAAAERGEYDALLTEHEDRISRNLGHLANVRDDLKRVGVTLATLATDKVETMHVAIMGLLAEQYLVELGRKTSRGMRSNAEKGLATGSRTYGYRTAPGGETAIVEHEAEVVRRIFRLFADEGLTGREIAYRLNAEHVPGPRGGPWNASTVSGSRRRGNGILHCEQYAGVKVWGRMDVRKDSRTGKRTPVMRPPEDWKRTAVEALRIVDAELWARVRARKAAEGQAQPQELATRRRPGLFTGLLKCGHCGASYTSYSKVHLICAGHRERGPTACSNGRKVKRAELEARVLEGLQRRMLSPKAVAAYARAYHAAWAEEDRARRDRRRPLERRLGEVVRTIERMVDKICEGTDTPATNARLHQLEAEKIEIEAQLAIEPEPAAIALHPGAAEAYAKKVGDLRELLASIVADPSLEQANRQLIEAVRGLVLKIEITPEGQGRGTPVEIKLHGDLSRFMRSPSGEPPSVKGGYLMVAGGRFPQIPPIPPAIDVFKLAS